MDGAEAMAGILDRRAGHDAEKLVAAEANDQVVGTQMTADRVCDTLQQRVARGMAVRVVDSLQPLDVDVSDEEHARRSPGTIDLPVEFHETGLARSRPREYVGLSERELGLQSLAVCVRLRPVTSRRPTVTSRVLAVSRRLRSTLSRGGAASSGKCPILRRALRSIYRTPLVCRSVARRQRLIAPRGELIAR